MSIVGNFVSNGDRTAATQGIGGVNNPQAPYIEPASDNSSSHELEEFDPEKRRRQTADSEGTTITRSGSLDERERRRRDQEVHALARKFTQQSHQSTSHENPFQSSEDSRLNPHSPNFSPRAFAKSLLHLQSRDPEKWKARTAGFAFKDLNVYGFGSATDYQKTVGNYIFEIPGLIRKLLGKEKPRRIDILQNLDGVVHSGEMLVVLGPPGSGCSTFLKTVAGETNGFFIDKESRINYQGISPEQMHRDFRGEAIYTAEVDVHFPMLTVGQTLEFAAMARTPRHIPGGITRDEFARYQRDVMMASFGISHTINTYVGNDFIRGVSGGERKRTTIAEACLSGSPLQCWDNSTRGLDSANAIEFVKTLKMSTDLMGATCCVAIYQSPQSAYDLFDKVLVLYEGRQIFFGPCTEARGYFENMGFECPAQQTTADFLTSMTSHLERVVRPGFEDRVPRTADEFALVWKNSPERAALVVDIDAYNQKYQHGGQHLQEFQDSRRAQQSKHQHVSSPYTMSYIGQVKLCLRRGFWRLIGDPSLTLTQLGGNSSMALIIASVFYDMPSTADSFFSRSALIFFAILMSAFSSALEILTLYAQRPIVEKHARYALYHPSCEAIASMLTDMPYKILNAILFNVTLYFMSNLNRQAGNFFFFLLVSFLLTLVMSMLFRTIASVSRTLSQALAPAAVLILAIVIYTGFALPVPNMLGWARWLNYIDPVAYAFESLMVNEFAGKNYTCLPASFIPSGAGYEDVLPTEQICSVVGAVAGQNYVEGAQHILTAYTYKESNKWRNVGIMFPFLIFFCATYIIACEYITSKKSKGEVLLFRRGRTPAQLKTGAGDIEGGNNAGVPVGKTSTNLDVGTIIKKQTAIFSWEDVCYDIKIKGEPRRILDHVDGWVKPGTLTALMGVSGAGKTTLLDVLATRTTMGVITGNMLVDGRPRDDSFQRKTGYVQQQDLHLSTTTVREALTFSALLRQPAATPRQEKIDYVDEVIKLLDMEEYADAIVGVPGEGLNVEQRKRLTIGVELAAKPELLLFLDEPTSGLDSQTSWAICDLMEKLTKNGQAILCTIHQPSAMLFQRFDRLLFLAKGGRTVYFGEVGEGSHILIKYFERFSGMTCPPTANPAEWMLEVIGAAPGTHSDVDWHEAWRGSPEYQSVKQELARLADELPKTTPPPSSGDKASYREFAAPMMVQQYEVMKRVFQQYWRTPNYIFSKTSLCVASAAFIGFSFFDSGTSQQELQNQMFAIFMIFTIFGNIVQQIMPHFVTQRALYEVRERPSKTYSWAAFMVSNIVVELPWNTLMSILMFFCWYYPAGLYKNASPTDATGERGLLMFLFLWVFLLFTSTFATMVIAAVDSAEVGGNIANLAFSLTLIFCGVLASPDVFPRFWIFMYRVSPFTYLVDGMLSVGIANNVVECSAAELRKFTARAGQTCAEYMNDYIVTQDKGGRLLDPNATGECSYCSLDSTNQFLSALDLDYGNRWRNFGLMWVYVVFNCCGAVLLYWLVRVPKKTKAKKE
ncbi:uncharacterized protein L3040_002644 [Drepanopeziza brunnea f. sp. 'multigermtubi']|uniref:uncharacterized protein n=1 Tax=Drepanopeziza brunnea f. sp. 'multigermtubi' TaxID=698441 RepID=UPI00239A60D1|nr:hypothetical protein L3040_002644 [Drepanopeziza brunnea f. sp. 'multigermtubi']